MKTKAGKDPSLRYLVMLQMIPSEPSSIDADTIRERLEDQGYDVTLRTVQRDLVKLSEKFSILDIKDEDSRALKWYWPKGHKLMDIPGMSTITAFTFKLAETFCSTLLPKSLLTPLRPHFDRADSVLSQMMNKWSRLSYKVKVLPRGQELKAPQVKEEILEKVYDGICKEVQLEIKYKARGKTTTKTSMINPFGLVFRNQVIYLVCSYTKYNDPRHIALHRIKSVKLTSEAIIQPKDFDFETYTQSGEFNYFVTREKLELELLFDSRTAVHIEESPLSNDQTEKHMEGGKTLIKAKVDDTQQLRWWLQGFGSSVEILKPDSLREEFRKTAEELSVIYQKTSST